jgi:prophage DNA circulation protein
LSDWRSRLRPEIKLTSPDGQTFTASWQGNDIEGAKRVGVFEYPLVDGAVTQDLGAGALSWPLTLFFEGDTHDTQARDFARIFLAQRGLWKVVHPQYGTLTLQALTVKLSADPTQSANVSKVETSWIEPASADIQASTSELGAQVSAQVDVVNAATGAQFADQADLTDAEGSASVADAATKGLGQVQASPLAILAAQEAEVQSAFDAAYTSAMAALALTPMDLVAATAGMQNLMQLPALIRADLGAKITAYTALAQGIVESFVPGTDVAALNGVAVSELFLTSALTGVAMSVSISEPATREQAIQAITDITALFATVTAALDAAQTATAGNTSDAQYFSHSKTYADLARLLGLAVAFLLRLSFDLKIAKRFTLSSPRAPIEITITEYGELGEEDVNLDFFIASNHLQGDDIILLSAGREVVVYA